jgi:carboxyl-terminal processing protease
MTKAAMLTGRSVRSLVVGALVALALPSPAQEPAPAPMAADYRADAVALADLLARNYAYLDDLPGGGVPSSDMLKAERDAVHDRDSLLRYAEDMITALADHHALTGRSFKDDWAIIPTYADIWVVSSGPSFIIDSVRPDSPAATAGIGRYDRLAAVDGIPIADAVQAFWGRLGLAVTDERSAYAARTLAAGRRDRPRHLTIVNARGQERVLTLASLYNGQPAQPPISVARSGDKVTIRFNNALFDDGTIAAFDKAMAETPPRAAVLLDLTDTPSGGNTSVARAIMGWFVTKPMFYQMHNLPSEERETGIPRQWVEQVLPRAGKHHPGPVRVTVGRWTGSVGEGLAVGFAALGKPVCGGAMAGLKGAVYDFDLPKTQLRVKFPAERIYTASGKPREKMVFGPCQQ